MASNGGNLQSQEPRLCIVCAREIPLGAKKCTNDNCGAFQDWRRFVGGQVNIVSLLTICGLAATLWTKEFYFSRSWFYFAYPTKTMMTRSLFEEPKLTEEQFKELK